MPPRLLDAHNMRVQTIRRYAFGPCLAAERSAVCVESDSFVKDSKDRRARMQKWKDHRLIRTLRVGLLPRVLWEVLDAWCEVRKR